jgi:hypothetical protein
MAAAAVVNVRERDVLNHPRCLQDPSSTCFQATDQFGKRIGHGVLLHLLAAEIAVFSLDVVAITGVAGPDPDEDGNPVGLVCIAVARATDVSRSLQ